MDDKRFWSFIESAWKAAGGMAKARQKLAEGTLSDEKAEELVEALDEVMVELREQLEKLPKDELVAFDRALEKKLYDIDRAEIQKHTDGSDDGFLYARGFIVAVGKGYYDAVHAKPDTALMDMECEEMCYLSMHVHRERFGKDIPLSDISRETGSNKAGWADAD